MAYHLQIDSDPDSDLDPAYNFDADPDPDPGPTFHFDVDPDPQHCK